MSRLLMFLALLPLSACLTTIPDKTGYEIDGSRVRWVGLSMGSVLAQVHRVTLREADAATFRPIDDNYAVDARHVFYRGEVLPDEDPSVFRVLPDGYAVGSACVYNLGEPLPGANPATWRLFEGTGFSTDGVRVFAGQIFLEDADATTFRARGFAVRWARQSNASVARDARNFYRGSIRIGSVDDCGRTIGHGPNWVDGGWHHYRSQEELDYLCADLRLPGETFAMATDPP